MFVTSCQDRLVPPYVSLLACSTTEDVVTLNVNTSANQKLDFCTILSPGLANLLYEEEDMDAVSVMLKFVCKIQADRQPRPAPVPIEVDDGEVPAGDNVHVTDDDDDASSQGRTLGVTQDDDTDAAPDENPNDQDQNAGGIADAPNAPPLIAPYNADLTTKPKHLAFYRKPLFLHGVSAETNVVVKYIPLFFLF